MSKSYKLKNGFIDSTGIVHKKEKLSEVLEKKIDKSNVIQENGTVSTSNVYSSKAVENLMKGTTLYDTENVNYSTVTLNDNISNYSYIEVIALNADNGIVSSGKIPVENGMLINLVSTSFRDSQNTLCFWLSTLLGSGNKLTPQTSKWFYFSNGYGGLGDGNYIGVTRVIGYK